MRPEIAKRVEEARAAITLMDGRRLEARRLRAFHEALLITTHERDLLLAAAKLGRERECSDVCTSERHTERCQRISAAIDRVEARL